MKKIKVKSLSCRFENEESFDKFVKNWWIFRLNEVDILAQRKKLF